MSGLKNNIKLLLVALLVFASGYFVSNAFIVPEVTVVEKEKIVYKTTSLQIDLEMLYPKNEDVLTLKEDEKIKLLWNKWDAGTSYELIVKSNQDDPRVFNLGKNELELDDFKGDDFEWSLTAISKNLGQKVIKGNFKIMRLEAERAPASVAIEPVVEVSPVIIYKEKGFKQDSKNIHLKYPIRSTDISWHGESDKTYHVIVKNLRTGHHLIDENVSGVKKRVSFTTPGKYKIFLLSAEDNSEIDKFNLTYEKEIGVFSARQPIDFLGRSLQINFELNQVRNAMLEVYNKDTNAQIGSFVIKGNAHRFKVNDSGHFCFRLKSRDASLFLNDSDSVCAKIKLPAERMIASVPEIRPKNPGRKILNYYRINGQDTYQFDLPEAHGASEYQIQIFNDKDSKDLLKEVSLKGRRVFWKTQREAKVYMKYRIKNSKGESGHWSELSELIFPISPLEPN